jgi:hypothetical protein
MIVEAQQEARQAAQRHHAAAISILVLAKNEQDLPQCLESVSWSDDVVVYDSESTDDTLGVAKRFGSGIDSRRPGRIRGGIPRPFSLQQGDKPLAGTAQFVQSPRSAADYGKPAQRV